MILKRITYYLKIRINLLMMRYFNKTRYNSHFQVVYSNLLIAFQDKFSLSKYRKLTKSIIFKKFYGSIDEILNNKKNYLGIIRNLYSEQISKLKTRFPNSDAVCYLVNKYEKKRLVILSDAKLRWQYYFKYFHQFKFENLDILENSLKANKGALVCCFHLGQFRLIADYLNARGFIVKLLLDKKTYELDFKNISERLSAKENILPDHKQWEFIIAEDLTIALTILRSFQNNEIVLFYLDGNTGSGQQQRKAEVIPFFNQLIYARRGAIQLAISNNTPIIPITSKFRGFLPAAFKIYPEIKITEEGTVRDKAISLTKSLYMFFTEIISEDPTQWALWFTCHKFWVKKDFPSVDKLDEENKIFQETEDIISKKKKSKIILNKYNLSYFIGTNSRVALVDIKSGRFFSTSEFLERVVPQLFKEEMYVDELVNKFARSYSEKEIILSLATLKQRGYLYFN